MKLVTRLGSILALVGAGILIERWRQQRLRARTAGSDLAGMGADVILDAEVIGIAEVDPEPMTQIAGEGIDPDVPVPPRTR